MAERVNSHTGLRFYDMGYLVEQVYLLLNVDAFIPGQVLEN